MRTVVFAALCLSSVANVHSSEPAGDSHRQAKADGCKVLVEALDCFKLSQPCETLDDAPDYVRRNRGVASYLAGLMKSQSVTQENKDRITSHFLELLQNKDRLLDTAKRLDQESGKYYRESLRCDVLRFIVEVISDGKESLRFSSPQFNEAYFSVAEGRSQLFHVVLPSDYSPDVRYPLFVQVFGSASLLPSGDHPFIRVRPNGRGVWGYRSMSRYDVMQAIRLMKQAYNIDDDRVYMTGTSACATGMMHAAAYRQDVFAGLVPLVAFGNDLPLENYRNLPTRCEHGVNDWTSSIGNVRVQFQRLGKLKYDAILNEHPSAGHGIRMPPPQTMEWLFNLKRDSSPKHIVYSCEHPRDGKAYWLRIEAFVDPHKIARLEAKADADSLSVATHNVRQFSLDVTTAPLRRGQRLAVDGATVKYTLKGATQRLTIIRNTDWEAASAGTHSDVRGRAYGAGAAANLFQGEPLLIIHGTGANDKENQFLRQAANILARSAGAQFKPGNVRFPVKADSDLENVPLDKYNLLVVGTSANNSYLQKIAARLPYSVESGVLRAEGREPLAMKGSVLSFHYFNPVHPRRLVYVVSPYLNAADQMLFLKNPRVFLAGSSGFKMIDQPDLLVRGADLRIRREMQLDADWEFITGETKNRRIPQRFSDRTHLAIAHMKVMQKTAQVDFALWWGPEDKGAFGGYDFNWLPTFDPTSYTLADYLTRRRETESMTAVLSGEELLDILDRWIGRKEIISWPEVKRENVRADGRYSIVIPMDLVVKLGNRRKTLSTVAAGPAVMPEQVANEVFSMAQR